MRIVTILRLMALAASETAGHDPIRAGDRLWCVIHSGDIVVVTNEVDRAKML